MADRNHYEQCAVLLEQADEVITPARPFELELEEREQLGNQTRRDLKFEALIHAVLHLGENVAHLVDILVAERER